MSTESLDDFQSFGDRSAEVGGPADGVALIQVVRSNSHQQQFMHQFLHHLDAVVDTLQQDSLGSQRNSGICEASTGASGFGGAFVGMQEVHAHPERVVLSEHTAQFRSDSLGQYGRHFGADADEFDMWNRAESSEDPVEFFVTECKRVATGDQHIADLDCIFQIVEDGFQSLLIGLNFPMPDDSRPCAVAAVGGAEIEWEQQDAVGVPMNESGDRAVAIFSERVICLTRHANEFAGGGYHGFSQCLQRVMRIQQAHVIRSHSGGQERSAHGQAVAFFD